MKLKLLLSAIICGLFLLPVQSAEEASVQSETPVIGILLPFSKEDADKRIEALFSKPFFVKTNTGSFVKIEKEIFNDLIKTSSQTLGENSFTLLSLDNVTPFSEKLGDALYREKRDTVLLPSEERYTVEGELQNGHSLDQGTFLQLIRESITRTDSVPRAIELPLLINEAHTYIQEGDNRRSVQLIGQGESDFSGSSSSRVHNIRTAMATMNGLVIGKNETFSFNEHIGEVDGSTGYKLELVIKGAETVPEYGGGVCQFSSTVYRAALRTGLPIVERKPHSYAVSYYEPWGSDATIYPGVVDLKFSNDLPAEMILHTFIDGEKLFVNFYGESDGRRVELSGPNVYGHHSAPSPKVEYTSSLAPGKRVWKAYGVNGFSAWWERKIISGSGEVMTERINSVYEARPGAVMEGNPAPSEQSAEESV